MHPSRPRSSSPSTPRTPAPHLLTAPALAVLSTAVSAFGPGALFDAAVTCFQSIARV
uniref:Uncharacterized protein n=1 Tax=Arundo donax TaxID=35708 RepID=A0A0A9D9Q2_ARUDO